jgi:lipopolysaccharide transport system ATP-binding protein
MSDTAIFVENLSKNYLIGHESAQRDRGMALREVIGREAHNFLRKAKDLFHGKQIIQGDELEEFWALRDVSFEVQQGEIIGIIGRNGAGKSTLLKILSRITEPTEGRIRLRGRVSSLLEVGTGFHPELTGRENIFLNGAVLGMSRVEIKRKFDEIVAFADIEKFLDTPVKRYSSGMYVRLAFAIAAHLEPEILIVDEVLAVGDADFQVKCLGKMKNVTAQGRTVLFVSHNMNAVKHLTSRVVLLREGVVDFIGSPGEAIERYLGGSTSSETRFEVANAQRQYEVSGDAKILALRFDRALPHFEFGEPIHYIVSIRASRSIERLRVAMTIYARDGTPVGSAFSPEIEGFAASAEHEVMVTVPFDRLAPGAYHCAVSIGSGSNQSTIVDYDLVMETLNFEVIAQRTPNGTMASWLSSWGSITFPDLEIDS